MTTRYKGPRDQFIVRPTVEVGALIRKDAKETGRSCLDVCAEILAAHYGLPAYNDGVVSSITPVQQEFDMTG